MAPSSLNSTSVINFILVSKTYRCNFACRSKDFISRVLNLYVVAYLDPAGPDKVVLLIIHSVDLIYGLPHSNGSPWGWSLRKTVCQVYQDVVQNVITLNDKIKFQLFHLLLTQPVFEILVLCDCLNSFPDDGVDVEEDVLGSELLGLALLQVSLAEVPEAHWDHVGHCLGQITFDFFLDILVHLALDKVLTLNVASDTECPAGATGAWN